MSVASPHSSSRHPLLSWLQYPYSEKNKQINKTPSFRVKENHVCSVYEKQFSAPDILILQTILN